VGAVEAGHAAIEEGGGLFAAEVGGLAGVAVLGDPGGGVVVEAAGDALPGVVGVGELGAADRRGDLGAAGGVPHALEVAGRAGAHALAGGLLGLVAAQEVPAVGEGAGGEDDEGGEAEADEEASTVAIAGELGEQGRHVGEALLGIAGHAAQEDPPQPGGDPALARLVGDGGEQDGLAERLHVVAVVGAGAVEALVEADAEGVLIGAGGGGLAEVLLGRDVWRRAGEGAAATGAGVGLVVRGAGAGLVAVLGEGEAEVEDAGAAVGVDDDVVGFEVAVDDAAAVGGGEAPTGGEEHGDDLAPGVRASQPLAEREALDELHGDEDLVAVGADVEEGDDVGVRELGHGLGLAQEAGAAEVLLLAAGEARVQELDGDLAVELGVIGGIDHAHAAGAEAAEDDEAAELGRDVLARARAAPLWPSVEVEDPGVTGGAGCSRFSGVIAIVASLA
jgi:hypothetical protein